jgi:ribose transport system permease protein
VYFLATGITGLQFLGLSGWIENVFYGASGSRLLSNFRQVN